MLALSISIHPQVHTRSGSATLRLYITNVRIAVTMSQKSGLLEGGRYAWGVSYEAYLPPSNRPDFWRVEGMHGELVMKRCE